MNREILFRGKRVDNGQWVLGYIERRPSSIQMPEHGGPWYIWTPPKDPDDSGGYWNVDPATVGQYTGLRDKNGVKIFEGDIVKLKDYHGQRVVEIFYGRSPGAWFYGGDGHSDEYLFNSSKREVVGNIHDNPEMLGQEVAT